MHELSLMEAVRDLALEQARAHGGGPIAVIRLRIGSLAGVEQEALRFAHSVVMAGTALEIEAVPARFHCEPCGQPFEAPQGDCFCPRCGVPSRRLLQGRELELASLELS